MRIIKTALELIAIVVSFLVFGFFCAAVSVGAFVGLFN
jgi:hypothetical protein